MTVNKLKFNEIYSEYKIKIHRYLIRMVGADDAEDLTQEVFIKVDKALGELKDNKVLSTWIYRIATNTAIDRMRSSSYKNSGEIIPEDELISEDQSAWGNKKVLAIDQELVEKEMNQCIRDYIYSLPEIYRSVLVLSELEFLKDKEIADVLEITLETVKIRLHRARAKLKIVLDKGCNFYRTNDDNLACEPK